MRTMPSTIEYSLCRRRCTKLASDSETDRLGATDTEKGADAVAPDGSATTAEPGRESNALMGYNFTRFAAPVFCRISIEVRSPKDDLHAFLPLLAHPVDFARVQ